MKCEISEKYCLFLCCVSIPQLRSRLVIEMERGLGADAFITLLEASALLSRKKTNLKGKVLSFRNVRHKKRNQI